VRLGLLSAILVMLTGMIWGKAALGHVVGPGAASHDRRRARPAPSLVLLKRLVLHVALFGVPFLTMGLAAGVIRAETFRVRDWAADPVVLPSVGAWVAYLALIAGRVCGDWSCYAMSWMAIVGLVPLLAIRLVAVPYLSGFHTYGG
jgi:ABC-type transport system involved in cytochrome c biogenesis permease subunit